MNEQETRESDRQPGVISERSENGYRIFNVAWADGPSTEMYVPERGVTIVNPATNEKIGHLTIEQAKDFLHQQAGQAPRSEFTWLKYFSKDGKE